MEYPRIRNIEAFPVKDGEEQFICLRDPQNYSDKTIFLSPPTFFIISMFDGKHSVIDIQTKFNRKFGEMILSDEINNIITQMDENLFLETEQFIKHKNKTERDFLDSPVRKSLMALRGMEQNAEATRKEVEGYFVAEGGPGLPEKTERTKNLKGAVMPHIDYKRGGLCYAWGYKEILERTEADIFVILGTNHSGTDGIFSITDKDFETPFGKITANKDFIKKLENRVPSDLRAGEFSHRNEHSIELQATFLHAMFQNKKPFTIVPVLCGGFPPSLNGNGRPMEIQMVREFIESLKKTVEEYGNRVFLMASADFAHMGPQFGDRELMTRDRLDDLKKRDLDTIRFIEEMNGDGFYQNVTAHGDNRKICGLTNIFTLLKTMDSEKGTLLRYDQWPDEKGAVTFASIIFS